MRARCEWDAAQTHDSLRPYLIEEAYEVDDAIWRKDWDGLRDELGDLLLQVVFHAQIAREAGHFDFEDVVRAICDKLVRRHPHVFGDAVIESAQAQTDAWEKQKAAVEQLKRARKAKASVIHPNQKAHPVCGTRMWPNSGWMRPCMSSPLTRPPPPIPVPTVM